MNLTLPHFIHFILVFLFVLFLILIISIITYRLGYYSSKPGIKSSKTKTAVFSTSVLFSSSDENGILTDTNLFKTEIPFEKKMKDLKLQR